MSNVTIACNEQSLEDLNFAVDQTNELVLTITYTRTREPIPNNSAVTASLEDGGVTVSGSNVNLGPESGGVFSGIFQILAGTERGRTYDLRVTVTIGGTQVINKTFQITSV